jgi:hypothetical protein
MVVADPSVCTLAATAYASARPGRPTRPVWVVRVGSARYVVSDGWGAPASGGRIVWMVFDTNWVALTGIAD